MYMVVVERMRDDRLTKVFLPVLLDNTPYSVFIPWITVSLQPKHMLSHVEEVFFVLDLVLVFSVKQILNMDAAAQCLQMIGTVVFD